MRPFRMKDERWLAAKRIADARRETMTEYLNRLVERDIRAHPDVDDKDEG